MKQLTTHEKVIGENKFYIKPFGAFTASNISGELISIISPLLGGLSAIAQGTSESGKAYESVMDIELDKALPVITKSFGMLSGDKLESLVKKLIVDNSNVSVEIDKDVTILDSDLADEIFCGSIEEMYALCFEVLKINYKGFFTKASTLYGSLGEITTETA